MVRTLAGLCNPWVLDRMVKISFYIYSFYHIVYQVNVSDRYHVSEAGHYMGSF